QLSEIALMAQDLVVIGRGKLIAQEQASSFISRHTSTRVRVRSPQLDSLVEAMREVGGEVSPFSEVAPDDSVLVTGISMAEIGELAHRRNMALHELSEVTDSLEDAFLAVTRDDQEYRSGDSQ
ncbi:MAG: ABC transporter ATP-binding protein, partial [Ilumatobacteraceae bacterium]